MFCKIFQKIFMRRQWFGPPKNFGLRTAYAYGPPPVLGVAPHPHSNKILVTSLDTTSIKIDFIINQTYEFQMHIA